MPKDSNQNKNHKLNEIVGDRIRLCRNVYGMTQLQLAEKVGVTFQQVQKYESGANRVSAVTLYKISQELNTDIGFFFQDGEDNFDIIHKHRKNIETTEAKTNTDSTEDDILQSMKNLDPNSAKELVSILNKLTKS